MAAHAMRLSGEEWQEWANLLLSRHYGPTEYQKVPDNQKGDAGIEGFTRCGRVYQAYGCEEPTSTDERYTRQRDKMTEDVGKFIRNKAILEKLFGPLKVVRWVLFVPYYDSRELVAHATRKTQEVIAARLPYVAVSFCVVVCDEGQFQAERDFLLNARTDAIRLDGEAATPEQIERWSDENDALLRRLDEKVRRLPSLRTPDQRAQFRDRVLKWYIEGQRMLETLRLYPQVYEKVVAAKSHRENYLATAALTHAGSPGELFQEALRGLIETYREEVREVARVSTESLAHEAVSDWLIRCPLDFPG